MAYIFSLLKLMTLLAMLIVYSVHGDGADTFKEEEKEQDFYVVDNVAIGRDTKEICCGLTYIKSSGDDSDGATSGDKIIGGSYVMHGEVPWVVALIVDFWDKCAGAILSEYWIITAAHCVVGISPDRFMLTAGQHHLHSVDDGEKMYFVANVFMHPQYSRNQYDYDIALLKIKAQRDGRGIEFNNYAQPVCLPDAGDMPADGTRLLSAGWGVHSASGDIPSFILKKAALPIMNHKSCQQNFGDRISSNMICVGNRSAGTTLCKGDSGGPAVQKSNGYYTIYGVTSFGNSNCNIQVPNILSSVPAYRRWIDDTIKANSYGSELNMPQRPEWKQSAPKKKPRFTVNSSPSSFFITFLPGLWPSIIVFCIYLVPLK